MSYTKLIIAAVALVAILAGLWALEHHGYTRRANEDVAALAKLEKLEAAETLHQTKEVANETVKYVEAITKPVDAPVIRVCVSHPARVPVTSQTGPKSNDTPIVRADDQVQPTDWSTEPVVRAGRDADAQVNTLIDYIENVCKPK